MADTFDVAVVGGGLLGSAIAWGLGRVGQRVCVLDEGDVTRRASRANFALVWVQSKGFGMPQYMRWTAQASDSWAVLADDLRAQTGLDVALERNGGFHLCLSEAEVEVRQRTLHRLHNQHGAADYRIEMMDHDRIAAMLPAIGPEVVGGSFCPMDGHVNSLRTYRAFHTGFARFGIDYRPDQPVAAIGHRGGEFRLTTPGGEVRASKIVLAAGNANQDLAPLVGLAAPMGPTRGQIIVTERTQPFLPYPITTVRQTDEGTVMIGDSKEDMLDDTALNHGVSSVMADRAQRMFPLLGRLNVVRSWAGIRVMPKDGFPIYDESRTYPGAFVACCHSGVTLAPNHAFTLAPMIARGALEEDVVGAFSAARFAGQATAGGGYY